MTQEALIQFIDAVRSTWRDVDSALVASAREHMAALVGRLPSAAWDGAESVELHRDAAHPFLLLAHTERTGHYRSPHDHGRGWVIYAVHHGEMEMATYRRLHDLRGSARLVRRESFVLRAGDVRVFLPGDIHDTRCTAGPLGLLRFTSRDFAKEEVTRYPTEATS